jgi:signal transduction histidine kinase
VLQVRDNGRGITEQQIANPTSLGLMGIRERARTWNGSVKINGIPGRGTNITISIPLGPKEGQDDKNTGRR